MLTYSNGVNFECCATFPNILLLAIRQYTGSVRYDFRDANGIIYKTSLSHLPQIFIDHTSFLICESVKAGITCNRVSIQAYETIGSFESKPCTTETSRLGQVFNSIRSPKTLLVAMLSSLEAVCICCCIAGMTRLIVALESSDISVGKD